MFSKRKENDEQPLREAHLLVVVLPRSNEKDVFFTSHFRYFFCFGDQDQAYISPIGQRVACCVCERERKM